MDLIPEDKRDEVRLNAADQLSSIHAPIGFHGTAKYLDQCF